MPYITEIRKEADLSVAMTAFAATCAANATPLGLTPANITEINGMASGFAGTISAYQTAKAATSLAHENKSLQLKASKVILSKWAKTFRANPAISDALLDQLNLPHHATPGTKTPPTTPLDLLANANVQGFVSLKWKRNGNNSRTQYMIEVQTETDGNWTIVGGTTKTKFGYQAVLGAYVAFRVFASRDNLNSAPCVPVVLWAGGGGQTLKLAA